MTDILQDLADKCAAYEDGDLYEFNSVKETYILLSRAIQEIERLRKANVDMGWELNPDRSGGQFTEEEKNRSCWL